MSDFDRALERLLSDPGFATALAADPDVALAGYRLGPEEREVLTTQVTEGGSTGGQHTVETRTSKSTLGGLFAGLAPSGGAGFGTARAAEHGLGAARAAEHGLGAARAAEHGLGAARAAEHGLGTAGTHREGFGTAVGRHGLGATGSEPVAHSAAPAPPPRVPEGYETRVDVDGDGEWDRHTLRASPAGGVEIHVDQDGDGRAEFVGHDTDADGLVDWSEYDGDRDGRYETRMYDDDGDGWLDRTVTREDR